MQKWTRWVEGLSFYWTRWGVGKGRREGGGSDRLVEAEGWWSRKMSTV